MNHRVSQRRAISPIIATLLLVLIAIAAGVIVYAYVVGFIGNSTSNSGGTTNTLSIDQLNLNHNSQIAPANAFVRNMGPTSEVFNNGFYVKGTSLNIQLGPAATVYANGASANLKTLTIAARANGSVSLTILAGACGSATAFSFSIFGASSTVPCSATGSGATQSIATTILAGETYSNGTASSIGSVSFTSAIPIGTSPAAASVIGVTVNSGATITVSNGYVIDLTLANPSSAGGVASNVFSSSAGITFTFSVTGADGATATMSAKVA